MIRIGPEIQCLPYAGFFWGGPMRGLGSGHVTCGPMRGLEINFTGRGLIETYRRTYIHTYGHPDSMTESAQWAESVKIYILDSDLTPNIMESFISFWLHSFTNL